MCVRIESNETSFQYGLCRVRIHVAPEATMRELADYSTVLQTSTIENPVRTLRTNAERQPSHNHCILTDSDGAIDEGRTDDNDEPSAVGTLFMTA